MISVLLCPLLSTLLNKGIVLSAASMSSVGAVSQLIDSGTRTMTFVEADVISLQPRIKTLPLVDVNYGEWLNQQVLN